MAVNIHLRDIEHVAILALIEANEKKQDQVIFKTKDQQHYDIFKFAKKEGFTGIALRVVRYTGKDKHEVVLPNPTNKQSAVVGKKSGSGKVRGSRKAK